MKALEKWNIYWKSSLNPKKPFLVWCSQNQIKELIPSPDVAVISITEPEDSFLVPEGYLEVLRLSFHDATEREIGYVPEKYREGFGGFKLFDEEMAVKIVGFLKRNSDNSILIHCRAGFSRSAAVAQFASDLLDREAVGWATPTTQFANSRVLRILHKTMWEQS